MWVRAKDKTGKADYIQIAEVFEWQVENIICDSLSDEKTLKVESG